MAFQAAAGYGNLPNGVWSPVLYSKKVLLSLKKKSVIDEITNTEFSGEINQQGDTVKIIKQPVITTQPYARGTIVTPQDIVDEDLTMLIDQGLYTAFYMDDIEAKQSHVDYMDMTADAAAYAIRDAQDIEILTYMASQVAAATTLGSTVAPVTIGFGGNNDFSPLDLISRQARLLNEQNIPMQDRFFVARPTFFEALRKEDSKFIEAQVLGASSSPIVNESAVWNTRVHGFKLYESNNLPTGAGYEVVLAGSRAATATAASILKNEVVRSTQSFGNINRSLFVYGRKVLRTNALALAYTSVGDV